MKQPLPPFSPAQQQAGTPISGCLLVSAIPHRSLVTGSHRRQSEPQSGCVTGEIQIYLLSPTIMSINPNDYYSLPPALPAVCFPCRASLSLCISSPGTKHRPIPLVRESQENGITERACAQVLLKKLLNLFRLAPAACLAIASACNHFSARVYLKLERL